MTAYEEPPIVDIDEILVEQRDHDARATRTQWVLVVAGGLVGIAGLLGLLVVASPALLELVGWISSIRAFLNGA
jgi:hypothetical protein